MEAEQPQEKVDFATGYISAPVPHRDGVVKPRDFKTTLPPEKYIELERQASVREITPYKLASQILQAWLGSLNQTHEQTS